MLVSLVHHIEQEHLFCITAKLYADLIKNFGKPVIAEQDAATKRKKISEELQAKQIELENLRAIASGKASAVIVQDDNELTKTRIANADSWEIVALARLGLAYRDNEASAITYNVGV